MSSEIAITVENLSKCYQIYDQPRDRLKQFVLPRLQRTVGRQPKQYYREFWALKEVSFDVKKGETVGIIGRNGSGKSTLLQMICGTVTPTAGTVRINGRIAALLELGAGFNPEFTGRENAFLNASILGVSPEEMQFRINQVLEFSELDDFFDQPVKTYSSGMYARLAFAVAIHVNPEILVVDEALAVGDARFTAKCMRRIKDIQNQGAAVLFVSHDVSAVRTLCQRAIWLENGQLVEDGDVFPVTGRYMAYMFRDEQTEANLATQENSVKMEETLAISSRADDNQSDVLPPKTEPNNIAEAREPPKQTDTSNPVTHWGSRKGLITKAYIVDSTGATGNLIRWGELIKVVIDVNLPQDISRQNLSVAFSIKDLKGSDLIVSTTHDYDKLTIAEGKAITAIFSFFNPLVTGKYLLVAALENRQYRDIHYYEYIEGAQYFSSVAEQRFFGIFQPTIQQTIEVTTQ